MSDGWIELGLLRHGATIHGAKLRGSLDDPLTPEGWRQMETALERAGHWDAVLTSPLSRCREFAEVQARVLGVPLRIDPRLQEIHFGDWEGLSYAELMLKAPLAVQRFINDPYNHTPPGGETVADFEARVLVVLADALAEAPPGRRMLVVTHGGVIRVMLRHARSWPRERLLEMAVEHGSLHRLRGNRDHCEEIGTAP